MFQYFLIYCVVLLYRETGNILEIFCVSLLDNLKVYFGQTSNIVYKVGFPQNLWHQIGLTPDVTQ